MKIKNIFLTAVSGMIVTGYSPAVTAQNSNEQEPVKYEQSSAIQKILDDEKNDKYREGISEVIDYIDTTYSDLYGKLKSGSKITIFFDPAHGLLRNGEWQGDVTWRQSSERLPEEFYSLALSRKLYTMLKDNQHIKVISTDDYINALEGKSDLYSNIPFSETLRLAKSSSSFMIISSHLNNIAPVWKADGVTNIPGIQITCDKYGNQLLTDVKTVYKGYLTMYNKLDPSGFSYSVAVNFKNNMMKNNLTPNNWDYGAVAYDRFSFFYDFPISILFESGFISNPVEEEMLRTESMQDIIAASQYEAILNAVKSKFGIDISGSSIKKASDYDKISLDALKLSRLILYYINRNEIQSAINLCSKLEQDYKNSPAFKIDPYIEIKKDLVSCRNSLSAARKYRAKKSLKTARNHYMQAISVSKKSPVYYSLKYSIIKEYNETTSKKLGTGSNGESSGSYTGHPPVFQPLSVTSEKHSYNVPYIFIYEDSDDLKTAIERSITSDPVKAEKLLKNFQNAAIKNYSWKKYYSSKDKKYKWKKVTTVTKVRFSRGIFILKLDSNMKISSWEKVSRVSFNPKKYQNQLLFKNSYLGEKTRNRLL